MPRLPNQVKNQPFGTTNVNAGARQINRPVQLIQGPAQGVEQLNTAGIPVEQARALQALQKNITAATQPSRANPAANGNLLQGVPLSNGGANGANPNVIRHGLSIPFVGYQIHAVYGGALTAHANVPNTNSSLDSAQISIWTQVAPFSGQSVTADIWVYG